jgi:hypothetical protein
MQSNPFLLKLYSLQIPSIKHLGLTCTLYDSCWWWWEQGLVYDRPLQFRWVWHCCWIKGPNSLDALRFSWCTIALLCNVCAVRRTLASSNSAEHTEACLAELKYIKSWAYCATTSAKTCVLGSGTPYLYSFSSCISKCTGRSFKEKEPILTEFLETPPPQRRKKI